MFLFKDKLKSITNICTKLKYKFNNMHANIGGKRLTKINEE